jgi:hypothetical protein
MGHKSVKDPCFQIHLAWDVEAFRNAYPDLRLTYLEGCGIVVEGPLDFRAIKDGFEPIEDVFELRCDVMAGFPKRIPLVFETEGRIPVDYHKLENGALCLGSPVRQRMILADHPTLSGFVEALVVPYLYNRSYFERHGCLPVGELEHGPSGLIEDYQHLFGVVGIEACLGMLQMLGMKKRDANKRPCPCGSGRRVGKCHNRVLKPFRNLATRRYYREHGIQIQKQVSCAGGRSKIG